MARAPYTPFGISVATSADRAVVAIAGDLDLATASRFEETVKQVRSGSPGRIVLDLRDVEFIDSTGLRLLLTLRNDAKRNGRALTLVTPLSPARRIFDITVTRELFDWVDDPARA